MIKVEAKFSSDMEAAFDRLTAAAGEATLRAAGFAGADLIRNQAVRNAPEITGVLKNNIIVKRAEEKSNGNQKQTYVVAIRKGKMNVEGDAFYGLWVEEGHKIVGKKAKGTTWKAHRSAAAIEYGSSTVPAHPFMRPAWESLKGVVLEVMRKRMAEKIKEQLNASV